MTGPSIYCWSEW